MILFEMLAGRRPFESEDKVKIISMHLAHAPPRIRDVNPTVDVPLPLEQAVLQAMEKSRENRFATAAAFLQALEDAEAPLDPALEPWAATPPGDRDVSRLQRPGASLAAAACSWCSSSARSAGPQAPPRRHHARRAHRDAGAARRPPPPDLAPELKKVEVWLEDGDAASARRALETALSDRPKDGRVRYMLGRVAYDEDKRQEALDDYREAIALDPGFRGDPVLLGHVESMLAEPKLRPTRRWTLVIEHVGAPAADLLAKVANEGSDLTAAAARGRRAGRHRRGEARRPPVARHARAQEGPTL